MKITTSVIAAGFFCVFELLEGKRERILILCLRDTPRHENERKNSRGICWRSSARNDETVSLFFSCRHFLLLSLLRSHTQTTAETLCVLYKREEEEKLCQSVNNCFGIFWTNNGRVNSSNK